MAYIDLYDIHKNYDVKQIFSGMEFHLEAGERVAIVGPNGCGKSTLLKIAAGLEEPDEGKRVVDRSVEFGMLSQTPRFEAGLTTRKAIEAELVELKEAQERYQRLSEAIADRPEDKALLQEHAEVAAYLDHHNAWNLDAKIERVLQEFRLKEYEDRLVSTLSGGEQRRVALAGLILRRPDVLMLDEPTNHLDVYMVEFLEEVLLREKFTLLFISHDRYFIDRVATRIVEVEKHRLVSYKGGYQSYLEQKERRLAALQKEHENLLRLLKKEEEWLSRGVQARQTRNQGRKARVFELREKAKENPSLIRKLRVELEREKRSWKGEKTMAKKKVLFEIEDLSYSIGERKLIHDFSARILQRDKIAIVGPNGSGKSTLLKLLLGRLQPESGTIKQGVDISIGYFDQHREMLKEEATLIETFCPDGGDRVQVMGRNMHVYGYLKSFLFPKEYLDKKVGQLSGGEKNRVALALLFTKHYDCLILDEPTNDLDIQTINVLEEKLLAYQGSVLFVSHDRYFVDKIAQKLLILRGDGSVEESHRSYTEYLELEKEIRDLEKMEREYSAPKAEPRRERKRTVKLSYKEQRDLEMLPEKIEELEAKIDELNACLADPECYNEKGLSKVSEELSAAEAEYESLSDRYLELLEKVEEMEQGGE
ncbi:ribosomal protection-like ABC-F family protein [Nitratifractor sp.]